MNELLKKIYPLSTEANRVRYAEELQKAMKCYDISSVNRQRAFLAQLGHECAQLSAFTENTNYSAVSLRKVFGKYFPNAAIAERYARNPQMIANRVYANRMGNGDESSGDGWKYRGRGGIQITGRDNYLLASKKMAVDFLNRPELLTAPQYALLSAAWWWSNAGLNLLADKLGGMDDEKIFVQITRRINGGTNGLKDRLDIYIRTKSYII